MYKHNFFSFVYQTGTFICSTRNSTLFFGVSSEWTWFSVS